MNKTTPPPGSEEAGRLGCLCPVMDNSYGKGHYMIPGLYVYRGDCPLHRQAAELAADKADEQGWCE